MISFVRPQLHFACRPVPLSNTQPGVTHTELRGRGLEMQTMETVQSVHINKKKIHNNGKSQTTREREVITVKNWEDIFFNLIFEIKWSVKLVILRARKGCGGWGSWWRLCNIRKIHLSRTTPPSGISGGTTAQVVVWNATTFSPCPAIKSPMFAFRSRVGAERTRLRSKTVGPSNRVLLLRLQPHAARLSRGNKGNCARPWTHTKTCHALQAPHEHEPVRQEEKRKGEKMKTERIVWPNFASHFFFRPY